MNGHSGGREVLTVLAFGPVVAATTYVVFATPAGVSRYLAAHSAVGVAAMVACAALAAYACRRVVQALMRLCGFR